MNEVSRKIGSVLIVTFGLPLTIKFLLSFIEILFLTEIKITTGGHVVTIALCTLVSFISMMLAFVQNTYILKQNDKI